VARRLKLTALPDWFTLITTGPLGGTLEEGKRKEPNGEIIGARIENII
jgi:hypothetical protein